MPRSRARCLCVFLIALATLSIRPVPIAAQVQLLNGQSVVGTISAFGELDQYFFSATGGDSVIVSVGEVGPDSTGFSPSILVTCDAAGTIGQNGGPVAAEVEGVVPFSTTCFVYVAGWIQNAGTYTLTLAKSPGAFTISAGDEGGAVGNGSTHSGTIHVGDLDMWSFFATAGDAILVSIGEVGSSASFRPSIRLKGPTGLGVASSSDGVVARIDTVAPTSGTYTIIISSAPLADFGGSGDYTLTVVRTPGPYIISAGDEGGELTNGANHLGTIHVGDLDVWSFTAAAGDAILIAVGEVGGNSLFTPWIRLRSPTGQNLGSNWGGLASQIGATATFTGTYTVVVASQAPGHESSGMYTLTMAKAPGAFSVSEGDEGGPATNGSNHTGVIQIGDLDMWTFDATAGNTIVVSIGETGPDSDFAPRIRLRSPTGQTLFGPQSGNVAARIHATATVTGTYTIIVDTADTGLDGVGSYIFTIAVAPGAPFTISGGDQGGPLAPGDNAGAIHLGDVDAWTFAAEAGDVVRSAMTVTSGTNFSPWLLVLGPSGPMPFVPVGGQSPVPYSFVAPETGLYIFVVASSSTEGIGSYSISASASSDMILNGNFDQAETYWQFFATPSLDYVVHEVTNGRLEYYRVPPPPGTTNQAVAYQHTGIMVPPGQPLLAHFDLANTSAIRKRISVLVLDASFLDSSVCTFWLEPNAPMRTYQVRTQTSTFWVNAALYFYASTAGEDGGRYQIDNVSLRFASGLAADRTDCVDPTAPMPSGGLPGPNLLVNGDFNTGALEPWFTFGTITALVFNGTLNFTRPFSTPPAGVVAQQTGQALLAGEIVTAVFSMGNGSNGGRRRVTVILHDADFSDLSACTFWLEPGQPRSNYEMRTYATKPWANAMLSIYPATVGFTPSLTLDDVTFQRTPGTTVAGTECVEPPGAVPPSSVVSAAAPAALAVRPTGRAESESDAAGLGTIDLRDARMARLVFESQRHEDAAKLARALVQVSLDGIDWVTLDSVPPSDDWTAVTADLSAFLGRVVRVRFVLDAPSGAFERPDVWRIRRLQLAVR